MADDAIEIHPGTPNVYYEQKRAKGQDTKPLMDSAAYVVEGEYYLQRQPHLTMEPDVGLAYFDDEGRLTIQSKSIGIFLHHAMICAGLGIEPEKLRIVQNPAGGTFGYKFSPTMEALLGVAAIATGKPVTLKYDYYQHITYTGKRSPFFINLKYGADKEGKIVAMEGDWVVDHGPVLGIRRSLDRAWGSVHRSRVRYSEHSGQGIDRLHESRVGLGISGHTVHRRAFLRPKAS